MQVARVPAGHPGCLCSCLRNKAGSEVYACACALCLVAQGPPRQYVTVMQPSEGSFAVAIVVDATGAGPFIPPPPPPQHENTSVA